MVLRMRPSEVNLFMKDGEVENRYKELCEGSEC